MHPRNTYSRPPNFLELARRYPPLRSHVFLTHTGPTIDFKSQLAQRRLTETLLHLDFNIDLTLPETRLCPPACRGTGASAIYPLLACRLEPNWCFVATDIDKESLISAQQNVERNGLSDRVFQRWKWDTENGSYDRFHFTMCNPPFYSSADEVAQSAEAKEYGPNAENEMITPGGEVQFVSRIFIESLRHRTRCSWYTSMLGKMSSLPQIVGLLREHQDKLDGWAIAWSFGTRRLPDCNARIANPALQSFMPSRTTLYQQISSVPLLGGPVRCTAPSAWRNRRYFCKPGTDTTIPSIVVQAMEVTWTRSARRKKGARPSPQTTPQRSLVLQCRITCAEGGPPGGEKQRAGSAYLEYQWVDGSDRGIFESFVSHVNRKVTAAQSDS
ncbi:hypothetical protein BU15DRAFT_88026 [Melanogaster broomeanus]|nr:hypothetical protein BU15DRAFT_88026 [Melanogaster broomeanus]